MFEDSMIYEENRLKTFKNWKIITITGERLARAGFYWPNEGENCVKCFSCNGTLNEWTFGMVAVTVHQEKYPNCPFLLGTDNKNVSVSSTRHSLSSQTSTFTTLSSQTSLATPSDDNKKPVFSMNSLNDEDELVKTNSKCESPTVNYDNPVIDFNHVLFKVYVSIQNRLKSFDNKNWLNVHVPQDVNTLVKSGFYYMGRDDAVQCFYCGLMLHEWTSSDDPVLSHLQYSPNCSYIRQLTGSTSSTITNPSIIETPNETTTDEAIPTPISTETQNVNTNENQGNSSVAVTPSQLVKSQKSQQSTNDDDNNLCIMCFERGKCIALVPCGHLISCVECSTNLYDNVCPICRTKIRSTLRVYSC